MNVTHLIKATRLSGAERHLLILLPRLKALGVNVRLLLLTEPSNPMEGMIAQAEAAGIPTQRVPIERGLDVRAYGRVANALRAQPFDILHTHLIHADTLGMLLAWRGRVPVLISTRHNDDAFRHRLPIRALNALNWRTLKAGIVISEALAGFNVSVEGAPTRKIHVIPYGMTHAPLTSDMVAAARAALRAELGVPSDAPLVGMMCRLTEQKGVPYGIAGFAQVAHDFPQAHLLIAGDGELRDSLQAQAQAAGLAARVHFVGWRADSVTTLAGLDVFLMPSLWEGFGLVLLEAMAARLPIVASHVSAIPEIVQHGETGYLVAARDEGAIAHALRLLLADRSLRAYLGQNGEDRLEQHFSAQVMATRTQAVYAACLTAKKN